MKNTIEKQRKYHIVTLAGTPTGKTTLCLPSRVRLMMNAMGVKLMRHLPKVVTSTEALDA